MLAAIVLSHELKILVTVSVIVACVCVGFGPSVVARLAGWFKSRREKIAKSRDVATRLTSLERRIAALEATGKVAKPRTTRKKGGAS